MSDPSPPRETIAALADRLLLDLEVIRCDCESDAYDAAVALVRAIKAAAPERQTPAQPAETPESGTPEQLRDLVQILARIFGTAPERPDDTWLREGNNGDVADWCDWAEQRIAQLTRYVAEIKDIDIARQMEMPVEQAEFLRENCNKLTNGMCHTAGCYKRAGWPGHGSPKAYVTTCPALEIYGRLMATTPPEDEPITEGFLHGVVCATTSYDKGWRDICARLLWAEARVQQLESELSTLTATLAELEQEAVRWGFERGINAVDKFGEVDETPNEAAEAYRTSREREKE